MPEDVRTVVRNNGGGHVNHTMFWQIMAPKAAVVIRREKSPRRFKADFGGLEDFKKTFNDATAKQFGSGWGWLVCKGGKLAIMTTPNQDNPLSRGLPNPWQRCLGARVLPEVQQSPPGLPGGLVERGELDRGE